MDTAFYPSATVQIMTSFPESLRRHAVIIQHVVQHKTFGALTGEARDKACIGRLLRSGCFRLGDNAQVWGMKRSRNQSVVQYMVRLRSSLKELKPMVYEKRAAFDSIQQDQCEARH